MDVIGGIITAGVSVIAIAIITNVAGTTILNIPKFGPPGATAVTHQSFLWNMSANNVSANAIAGFNLLSISPLVIAAALIISILLGVFILRR